MKNQLSLCHAFVVGLATLLLSVPQAMALDGERFIHAMMEAMDALDNPMSFGSITVSGDTVTTDGFALLASRDGEEIFASESPVVFSGVKEHDDGSFTADVMAIEGLASEWEDYGLVTEITGGAARIEGIYIPAGKLDFVQTLQVFERAELGPITISLDGSQEISIDRIHTNGTYRPSQTAKPLESTTTSFGVDGFKVRLEQGDPLYGELARRNREFIEFDFFTEVDWNLTTGTADMRAFRINARDLGLLEAKAEMSGATIDVMDVAFGLLDRADDKLYEGDYEGADTLHMQAGMAFMPRVTLEALQIRYEDRGLLRAIPADTAALLGIGPDGFMQNEETTGPAAEAHLLIEKFLANPGTLTVTSTRPATLFDAFTGFLDMNMLIEKLGLQFKTKLPKTKS